MWQSSFYCHCRFTVLTWFVLCIFVIDLLQNYIFGRPVIFSYHSDFTISTGRQLTVWYTRFTEKNKVWAKDVLFIMNFKCAPLRLLGGTRLHLKIYILKIKTTTRNQKSKCWFRKRQWASLIIITSFSPRCHHIDSS